MNVNEWMDGPWQMSPCLFLRQVRLGDEVRIRLACVYGNQEGRKEGRLGRSSSSRKKNIAQSEEVVLKKQKERRTEVPQN